MDEKERKEFDIENKKDKFVAEASKPHVNKKTKSQILIVQNQKHSTPFSMNIFTALSHNRRAQSS